MTAKSPNPIDVYVGARVRMRRLVIGMTQEILADRLGITFQQVQKYEKGTNRISASRLQTIANIVKVPVSFFFDNALSYDAYPLVSVQDFLLAKDGVTLNRAFVRIKSAKVRKAIVELTKALADEFESSVAGFALDVDLMSLRPN